MGFEAVVLQRIEMGKAEASPQLPWRGGLQPDLEGWGEISLAEAVGIGMSDSGAGWCEPRQ